jgi:hypothetical protein
MRLRHVLLVALAILAVGLAVLLPATPQPLAYHDFADQRGAYGIANFFDVASNLAFALTGLAILWVLLRRRAAFECPVERWPWFVFAAGLLLTSAGSCHYHLEPSNETLFWDRLPMTIAFMGLIAAQLVDRVHVRVGLLALGPMLLVGVASVVYWIATERLGRGNVVPYGVLQAFAVIALLKLAVFHPSRYTHGGAILLVFAGYVLAKGFEHLDREIFEWTGIVSGHTLKHVAAGLAGLPVAWMLWRRQPSASRDPAMPVEVLAR